MGCGVSKLDPGGATTLPTKLRPLFLRRLEEIRNRRHAQPLTDSTKKELLTHDRDEEDNASHFSSSECETLKNMPSPTKDDNKNSKNEPLPTGDGANSVGKFESLDGKYPTTRTGKDSKCDKKDEMLSREFSPNMEATYEPKRQGDRADNTKIEGKIDNILTGEDDSEYGDGENDTERMISHQDDDAFPGSPSFRVYFTDGKKDALRDAGLSDDKTSIKELPVKKESKRGRKIPSLRKVLPKGGQSTVKNLLNVRSCYNTSHSTRDRAHLLTAKTV